MLAIILGGIACFSPAGAETARAADDVIKIGEINSYTRLPAFTEPYRKGWQLAVEQINNSGGVLGKKLEVIARDDGGKPGNAVKIAEELITNEQVVLLAGTFFSHIGLAITDFAKQNKVLFIASEPLSDAMVWSKGNKYTFRLRPSTYMQSAMLAREAAKMPIVKWATIAPNYAYGKDAVNAFKTVLKELKPDVEFIEEQWPALFKIDAGATVRALEAAKPEGIFNVTFGGDLAKFVREGSIRGLFDGRSVVSLLTGEPEYLDPLKAEAPEGWIVTGYPRDFIKEKMHVEYVKAYQDMFGELPQTGSLVGYNTILTIAEVIRKAGSTDTEKMVAAMKNLSFDSPSGEVVYRASDHQSTMGAWVGKTTVRDGQGIMVDWFYADGADYLPGDEAVKAMRPAD
ncbi:twin-arginine translocation pathway signal protein [Sneathiella chinensis]|uniref:Twin-arginine translocation pathway signal protein n=1 Tax=Sneathiella chinensis TaxID=349750 RepID=A0ABQ5U2R5_9PROT|nr:twin-arginine translocation pathway signal protein [Sneathiella chinensis]